MKTKVLTLVMAICLVAFAAGCATLPMPGVTVITNIPYTATVMTVVNGDPELILQVFVNGRFVATLRPESAPCPIRMWNLSTYSMTVSVQVKIYDLNGKYIGAASRQFSVSGYSAHTETWIVKKSTLSWGW